jgi:hypothetical protein
VTDHELQRALLDLATRNLDRPFLASILTFLAGIVRFPQIQRRLSVYARELGAELIESQVPGGAERN